MGLVETIKARLGALRDMLRESHHKAVTAHDKAVTAHGSSSTSSQQVGGSGAKENKTNQGGTPSNLNKKITTRESLARSVDKYLQDNPRLINQDDFNGKVDLKPRFKLLLNIVDYLIRQYDDSPKTYEADELRNLESYSRGLNKFLNDNPVKNSSIIKIELALRERLGPILEESINNKNNEKNFKREVKRYIEKYKNLISEDDFKDPQKLEKRIGEINEIISFSKKQDYQPKRYSELIDYWNKVSNPNKIEYLEKIRKYESLLKKFFCEMADLSISSSASKIDLSSKYEVASSSSSRESSSSESESEKEIIYWNSNTHTNVLSSISCEDSSYGDSSCSTLYKTDPSINSEDYFGYYSINNSYWKKHIGGRDGVKEK